MGAETVRLYPIMMSLEGKRVIVIGGGPVAERKIMGLLESGALVSVISPEAGEPIAKFGERGTRRLDRRGFPSFSSGSF